MTLDFWKIGVALIVQFAGVVWVASGVVSQSNVNTKRIEILAEEQLKRSQSVWTSGARLEAMERRLDRIEDKLDSLLGNIKK